MEKYINRQIILVKRPKGIPEEDCFKIAEISLPEFLEDQVLIKTLYLSVDPYMRGRMNEGKSYISPFPLNKSLTGGVVGEIVATRSDAFKTGDIVTGEQLPWQDYSSVNSKEIRKFYIKDIPVSTSLGVLGMPGLTAYFGMLDIGKPEHGETVVISGAAGAVGMTAGQIAKIKGARVVGIAGSDSKIEYLVNELGFDEAVNYKVKNFRRAMKKACPNGVDVYFDNVGGEISDTVISLINHKARIPLCGQISLYNLEKPDTGPRIQMYLLTKSALMKGFIVMDYSDSYHEGLARLTAWVIGKHLKYKENIIEGLENTPKAFLGLFAGENLGKQIVKVA
jgi:NADPH-dependent curcumin reductase CurA